MLSNTKLSVYAYSMIKYTIVEFSSIAIHVQWNARSDVTDDNRAYVDTALFLIKMTRQIISRILAHFLQNILYALPSEGVVC